MAGKFYFLFDADFLVIDCFNLEILMLPVEEKRGIPNGFTDSRTIEVCPGNR